MRFLYHNFRGSGSPPPDAGRPLSLVPGTLGEFGVARGASWPSPRVRAGFARGTSRRGGESGGLPRPPEELEVDAVVGRQREELDESVAQGDCPEDLGRLLEAPLIEGRGA